MGRSRLGKAQVERLLSAAGAPAAGVADEIDTLRAALAPALAYLVGAGDELGWDDLVSRAGLEADRATLLVSAARTEAVRDALWDLVTELNERRQLR